MNDSRYNVRMETFPIFGETHPLGTTFCVDPVMTFHMYPDSPQSHFPYHQEDITSLSYAADQAEIEQLPSSACRYPYQAPFPNFRRYECLYGPSFIRKRNERERQRVKCVNEGYTKLRHHLPLEYSEKRFSKVETLRSAIKYIKHLQALLYWDSATVELRTLEQARVLKESRNGQVSPTNVGFVPAGEHP